MRSPKFAQNSPENDIHVKQVSNPWFLGLVGNRKWSPFSNLGVWSPTFFPPKITNIGLFKVPKMGLWTPKSENENDIHVKQVSNPWFLGLVGDRKWSPFSNLGVRSPTFFSPKITNIGRFNVPKMGLWTPKSENRDHFLSPTIPNNDGIDTCFTWISFSGEFWANFENRVIEAHSWSISPNKTPKSRT